MSKDALTLAGDSPLALLTQTEDVDSGLQAKSKTSYVGFYTPKSKSVLEINQAIPGIKNSEPYLHDGTAFAPLDTLSLVGPTFRYWEKVDGSNKIVEASLTKDRAMKEAVLAIVLAYSGDRVVPCLATFKTSKTDAALDLVAARRNASDDEHVAKQGPIGKQLVKIPAALRVAGPIDLIAKTTNPNKDGETFNYHIARCRARLLNDVELQALMNALNDPEFNEKVASITESYESRKAHVLKVIEGE